MDNIYYQNGIEYKDGNASTWKEARLFTDSHFSSANYYTIGSRAGPKRGRCVILNYEQFLNPVQNRKGTEYDVSALRKTFESLNFDIIIHHDMTKRGTEFILDNACQGDTHDSGVRLQVDSTHSHGFQEHGSLIPKPDNPQSQPITADQFAFYCSYRSFYSYRDPEKGSWFISELTSTFDTHSHQEDLISMTTMVQKKVAEKEAARVTTRGQTGIKQMPLYFSTLLKKLIGNNVLHNALCQAISDAFDAKLFGSVEASLKDPLNMSWIIAIDAYFAKWLLISPFYQANVLYTMFRKARSLSKSAHRKIDPWRKKVDVAVNTRKVLAGDDHTSVALKAFCSTVDHRNNIV
ncbi:hypothetical protein TYRP_000287 [Tyrophagus putrescentiae]|nr:hypothetical protein TYRP_000287 [Tyrophagus putrescentiae]